MQYLPPGFEFIGVFFIGLAIFLIPAILYLITVRNTLRAISPQNRFMEPGQVWISLIPVVNIVWQFMQVEKLANSINSELVRRGTPPSKKPTYSISMAFCILSLCSWITIISNLACLAAIVCWIIHWVKVNEFKNQFLSIPFNDDEDSSIFGSADQYHK